MKQFLISCLLMLSAYAYADTRCSVAPANTSGCVPATQVRVLMYHRVTTAEPPSDTVVSPRMMTHHLDMIQKLGYTTITVSELVEFMQDKIQLPEKTVAITFDDGWKDNIVAAQMLAERNMSATFYVLSGVFDHPMYLSKDEVKWISKNRDFEIGAHSHTHFMEWVGKMDSVDDRIMVGEMVMSKSILEGIIGKPVTSFAWPFGYSRQSVLRKVSAVGFTSTVHVNAESRNAVGGNVTYITRINVHGGCNGEHLKKMLEIGALIECK